MCCSNVASAVRSRSPLSKSVASKIPSILSPFFFFFRSYHKLGETDILEISPTKDLRNRGSFGCDDDVRPFRLQIEAYEVILDPRADGSPKVRLPRASKSTDSRNRGLCGRELEYSDGPRILGSVDSSWLFFLRFRRSENHWIIGSEDLKIPSVRESASHGRRGFENPRFRGSMCRASCGSWNLLLCSRPRGFSDPVAPDLRIRTTCRDLEDARSQDLQFPRFRVRSSETRSLRRDLNDLAVAT